MFKYDKKQEVFEFGKTKVGGQIGEYPTVCVGTMFYTGHKIVEDDEKGIFDRDAAEALWNTEREMSDITGLPCMNQIVGESAEAIAKYIDWFASIEEDTAFLIDSGVADVRMAAVKYCDEVGLSHRAIYNSINASASEDELKTLRESKVDSAIVLAFNVMDSSVKGKMALLEGDEETQGLLPIAKEVGIKRPLIDVAALPLGTGAGSCIRSVIAIKGHLGLPTGGGFHNTASAWDWLKEFKKEHKEAYAPVDTGTNLVAQILGADFLLHGPIGNARRVFPAVAMVDIMLGETALELGMEIKDENHPYNKLI
ncbi:MAG: tetrahydromethanopterin S-methyltransferase subunit H [Methermicoccaceae archaeon]